MDDLMPMAARRCARLSRTLVSPEKRSRRSFDINQGDAAEQNDPWTTFRYFFVDASFDCPLQCEH
jgi:hypothetical protein